MEPRMAAKTFIDWKSLLHRDNLKLSTFYFTEEDRY